VYCCSPFLRVLEIFKKIPDEVRRSGTFIFRIHGCGSCRRVDVSQFSKVCGVLGRFDAGRVDFNFVYALPLRVILLRFSHGMDKVLSFKSASERIHLQITSNFPQWTPVSTSTLLDTSSSLFSVQQTMSCLLPITQFDDLPLLSTIHGAPSQQSCTLSAVVIPIRKTKPEITICMIANIKP